MQSAQARGLSVRPLDEMARLIDLPLITDGRGNLSFIEGGRHLPFAIERVYYLYAVPEGQMRAGHAHYELHQLMIAVSGSFDIHLDNGVSQSVVTLDRPNQGLLITSMVWREIYRFSPGAVCLVLASRPYEESDYMRDYATFLDAVKRLG